MLRWLAVLGLWLGLCYGAAAQAADLAEADRTAIRQTIEGQLEAFRRADAFEAFAYASPEIRRQFRTPELFMEMVRRGYPQVFQSREVDFRDLLVTQDSPTQAVLVVGPDGSAVMALYRMQKQPDGSWRIDGCVLLRSGEAAT